MYKDNKPCLWVNCGKKSYHILVSNATIGFQKLANISSGDFDGFLDKET